MPTASTCHLRVQELFPQAQPPSLWPRIQRLQEWRTVALSPQGQGSASKPWGP